MGENSKIEWADHTQNFWVGCAKVSPACDHCYAESWAKRSGKSELWDGERRRTKTWGDPIRWNAEAERLGIRYRVFANSLSDFFDNQVPTRWRDDAWFCIDRTPSLDWILLTKRPSNIKKMLPDPRTGIKPWGSGWPNVWLGTTVENQTEADQRVPYLIEVPARLHLLSCEPLLGQLHLNSVRAWGGTIDVLSSRNNPRIGWVICGGESGPKARPMDPDWPRSLRDQCAAAGVPFFFKQHGQWIGVPDLRDLEGGSGPGFGVFDHCKYDQDHEAVRVGKKAAGRLLDGIEHNAFPEPRP